MRKPLHIRPLDQSISDSDMLGPSVLKDLIEVAGAGVQGVPERTVTAARVDQHLVVVIAVQPGLLVRLPSLLLWKLAEDQHASAIDVLVADVGDEDQATECQVHADCREEACPSVLDDVG